MSWELGAVGCVLVGVIGFGGEWPRKGVNGRRLRPLGTSSWPPGPLLGITQEEETDMEMKNQSMVMLSNGLTGRIFHTWRHSSDQYSGFPECDGAWGSRYLYSSLPHSGLGCSRTVT